MEEMEALEIIDAHEHLPPEADRLKEPVDVFTLFSHYLRRDFERAGMTTVDFESLLDRNVPLDERWKKAAPYWERVRFTSYARAALLAAEKFYGAADINEKTYADMSAKMQAMNRPGIYERVLRDACRIKTALTQCSRTDLGTPLLTPVMPLMHATEKWMDFARPAFDPEASINSLDDYLDAYKRYVVRVKSEGAVGMKIIARPYEAPNRREAEAVFARLKNGSLECAAPEAIFPYFGGSHALKDYITDEMIAFVGAQDLTVAVHTGYWGDFRQVDPTHMIPLLMRHPDVRFDIYHAGYPYVREALMMGKGFSNVWLNFCWTHIISQKFATDALDEAMDLVPVNKILAFGGDYRVPVEKVYGHLVMAREDVARVLGRRLEAGLLTDTQASRILRLWFHDNAVELYRLSV